MTRSAWAVAADLLDPPKGHAAFEQLGYTPNPGPQTELHDIPTFSDGGPFDVLYGGAAFGGKSYGLLMDVLAKCARHPRLEAWWVRKTYPQLRDSVLTDLENLGYARTSLGCGWNGSARELRFPNGSLLKFRHARNLSDAAEMLSASCQLLILDERTTLDPKVVEKLATRVRSGKPGVPVIGVRSATNPGGPGHSAVKAAFIDPAPLGRHRITAIDAQGEAVQLAGGRTLDRYFLPARIDDNPAGKLADPDYFARFALASPELIAAYRDGDWSRFEGMRFASFDMRTHVVPAASLDIALAVRKGQGIDWGSAAPFACIWGAVIAEQLVVYRELHQAGLTTTAQAKAILAAEREGERKPGRPMPAWADPSMWARDPEKPMVAPLRPDDPPPGSRADMYRKAGVPVRKAFNPRVDGWSFIDELLGSLPDGRPRLVISDACPNLIRSITGAPRSPKDPEDVDEAYGDDHAVDAFRYLACGMLRRASGVQARQRNGDRVVALTGGLAQAGF